MTEATERRKEQKWWLLMELKSLRYKLSFIILLYSKELLPKMTLFHLSNPHLNPFCLEMLLSSHTPSVCQSRTSAQWRSSLELKTHKTKQIGYYPLRAICLRSRDPRALIALLFFHTCPHTTLSHKGVHATGRQALFSRCLCFRGIIIYSQQELKTKNWTCWLISK